jgi:hypothetical protein
MRAWRTLSPLRKPRSAAEATVTVLAVGVKEHNDLFIRGKRVEL